MSTDISDNGKNAESRSSLFNENLEKLSLVKHRNLGINRVRQPSFLHKMHMISLTLSEFGRASSEYAIVFIGPQKVPVAITGVAAGVNELVGPDGAMKPETYIPEFARNYPFVLIPSSKDGEEEDKDGEEDKDSIKLSLHIDRSAPMISENPELAFFDDKGEMSEFTQKVLKSCVEFERKKHFTLAMVRKFDELDLFEKREETFNTFSGVGKEPEKTKIAEYWAISGKKLDELSDEQYLELRSKGVIGAIYAHLVSLRNWAHIMRLRSDRLDAEMSASRAGE